MTVLLIIYSFCSIFFWNFYRKLCPMDISLRIGAIKQAITEALFEEYHAQRAQVLLLLPVFFSFGIGIYFALPFEPPGFLGVFVMLVGASIYAVFKGREYLLPLILLLICLGFSSAQLRTHIVHTPILKKDIGPVTVIGEIDSIEGLEKNQGARLVLSHLQIEDLEAREMPKKVRLKIWHDEGLKIGQRIEVLAKMMPPSPPVIPGGFDFQRYLYFQSVGAVGFIYKDAKVLSEPRFRAFSQMIEAARQGISQRIEAATSYPASSILLALTVGKKAGIAEEDNEAMRASGLAHMLAISGLHVGLLSGALFFIFRFLFAAVPGWALFRPIKNYAAILAVIGAAIYMVLAGSTIPTVRAFLMIAVVFFAVMINRSPISLRLVAFAAFIVLLLFPESLFSASFHLSFAAVTGLVVFYNWLRPYWSVWERQAGFVRKSALYFLAICFTTIIATLATAPLTLFHFHQIASYGLIGNVLAMPLLALLIMPLILLAFILMPFGLEAPALWGAEQGANILLDVAHWVSSLPHAVFRVPMFPSASLAFMLLAGVILIVLRGRLKTFSLVCIAISLISIFQYKQYDILISSSNKLVSFFNDDGMYVSDFRKDRFSRESWMESYGLEDDKLVRWPKEAGSISDFMKCDDAACRVYFKNTHISYLHKPDAIVDECAFSDIVVADFPIENCGARRVIDLFDGMYRGPHAIYLHDNTNSDLSSVDITVHSSVDMRGQRPWSKGNAQF